MNRLSFVVFTSLLMSGCSLFEKADHRYPSYVAAVQSQSWKGGWFPGLLPKDALNIRESHWIDRSSVIVSFEFGGDFKALLGTRCARLGGLEIKFSDMKASWWPGNLYGEAFGSSHEYDYYRCSDNGVAYYALPFGGSKAYFWRRS